jgi:predicted lipid-binding transport protein (Tim44 family)
MKNIIVKKLDLKVIFTLIFLSLFVVVESAEARRMGFGRSIGKQAPIKKQINPSAPKNNNNVQKTNTAPKQNINNTKPSAKSRFMGPLAGLAVGLGLAGLASYLGFGEELMGLLMLIFGGILILFLFRFLSTMRNRNRMAFATNSDDLSNSSQEQKYSDEKTLRKMDTSQSSSTLSNDGDSKYSKKIIEDQEIFEFLEVAKHKFNELQELWDKKNLEKIQDFCSPEMAQIFKEQLKEGTLNNIDLTSVVELNADFEGTNLYTNQLGEEYDEAYVHFHGLIREETESNVISFSEIWTLQKNRTNNSGWVLSGITQSEKS